MVRSTLRLSLALLASMILSACILFPPFFPPFGFGMLETTGSIGLVSADGGDVERIGTLKDAYYYSPVWSPDGTWIAIARSVGMELTSSLVAIPADGGDEVILATGVSYVSAWRAPD